MNQNAAEIADTQSKTLQSSLAEVAASTDPGDCCVICLEPITEPCEARPCRHTNFDYICLINWLERQTKCPLCKAQLIEVRYQLDQPQIQVYKVADEPLSETSIRLRSDCERELPTTADSSFITEHWARRDRRKEPRPSPAEQVRRRRDVYQLQMYSLHIGTNSISQYRNLPTAAQFMQDPSLVSRARSWLRRELKVWHGDFPCSRSSQHTAQFILEFIVAVLKTIDLDGSQGQAQELIGDYLGAADARLLLHELKSFLRSPGTMEEWDRTVQYDLDAAMRRHGTNRHERGREDVQPMTRPMRHLAR